MSGSDGSDVTREGLRGTRPGREAISWHEGRPTSPRDSGASSYYGRPVIKEPVWQELDIAGYLFCGGLAGASSILAAGADLSGRPALARSARAGAAAAIGLSLAALVHDLGRPARAINMLRVFKPTSPMNMGSWLLGGYAPMAGAAAAGTVLGRAPRSTRAAGLAAALLGAPVATYTAVLLSDTAVPAWHGARRELPFVFAASAAQAAGGLGLVLAPRHENAPAARMAVAGALVELAAVKLLKRRLGMVREAAETGTAGRRLAASEALAAAGSLGAVALARRNRAAAVLSGAALLAGSALSRFGIFAAGVASAKDPRYTVEPQRERVAGAHSGAQAR